MVLQAYLFKITFKTYNILEKKTVTAQIETKGFLRVQDLRILEVRSNIA